MARKISHDQNFKNLILDYPLEALALFASEEALPCASGRPSASAVFIVGLFLVSVPWQGIVLA